MRHIVRLFAFAVVAKALTACGSYDSQSNLKDVQTERDKVVFAIMGGNTSCGTDGNGQSSPYAMSLYGSFRAVADEVSAQRGEPIRYLISCHTSESTLIYATSDAPDVIQRAPIEQTTALVKKMQGDDGKLYIAGHSYGGWLALQTALKIDTPVAGLISIDPISRVNCSLANPFGCMQFPSDVTAAQRTTIANKTDRWVNFWQNQTAWLHATATPQADANLQLGAEHVGIETQPEVWAELTRQTAL